MDEGHTNVYKLLEQHEILLDETIPGSYVLIYQKFQQMPFNNRFSTLWLAFEELICFML